MRCQLEASDAPDHQTFNVTYKVSCHPARTSAVNHNKNANAITNAQYAFRIAGDSKLVAENVACFDPEASSFHE